MYCVAQSLIYNNETSGDYAPMAGYNPSRGHGDYTGWAPWYQHISIFSTHQTGKHSHQSHQVSLVCLLLCMICLLQIQTENNTTLVLKKNCHPSNNGLGEGKTCFVCLRMVLDVVLDFFCFGNYSLVRGKPSPQTFHCIFLATFPNAAWLLKS